MSIEIQDSDGQAALDLSNVNSVQAAIGYKLGPSKWFAIQQDDIDRFGDITCDMDAMHNDPDWAQENSPFLTTIAFGFQTMSMMTAMMNDILPRGTQEAYKINYGFDRMRLVAPVPSGAKIRGSSTIKDIRKRDASSHIITAEIIVEIEGIERPAVIADWLFMVVNGPRNR